MMRLPAYESSNSKKKQRITALGLGALLGMLFGSLCLSTLLFSFSVEFNSFFPNGLIGFLLSLLALLGSFLLFWGLTLCFRLFSPIVLAATGGSILALAFLFWLTSVLPLTLLGVALLPFCALVGAGITGVFSPNFHRATKNGRIAFGVFFVLCLIVAGGTVVWIASPGTDSHLLPPPLVQDAYALILQNPNTIGPYPVRTLSYGSGRDLHRAEFGTLVNIKTEHVDLTPFLESSLATWRVRRREAFWGFDLSESPLNGTVYYPYAKGPFPLVLMVHGNHVMEDFSDKGYAYLAELLASRGYIVVSVCQNFLNGSLLGGDFQGGELPARAIHLLEHLRLWKLWNTKEDSLFYQNVDLDQIGLLGHSRGGEAIYVAAALNSLPYFPDNALYALDYNFAIRSLVAIAPTTDFYRPTDRDLFLADINYLVIHGGHDSDVSSFAGKTAYNRISFTGEEYAFKSYLYVYQANHGQFNSDWGRYDFFLPLGFLLNTKPLMSLPDQQELTKVYVAGFFDTTLKNKEDYLPMFKDYRHSLPWLPKTHYVNGFLDSTFLPIATFEEDINLESTTASLGIIQGENLTLWKEKRIPLRQEDSHQDANGVFLEGQYPARYVISLKHSPLPLEFTPSDSLVIEMASLKEELHLLLELTTLDGVTLSVSIPAFQPVMTKLPVQIFKLPWLESLFLAEQEIVLQRVEFPFALFQRLDQDFRPDRLATISFVFQDAPSSIVIRSIGIEQSRRGPLMQDPPLLPRVEEPLLPPPMEPLEEGVVEEE